MKTVLLVLLSIFALSYADFASEILELHNKERRSLGIKELVWSDEIAKSAQEWSDYLAENNLFKHSRTKGVGENLSRGTGSSRSYSSLFQTWMNEKKYFIPGKNYPECSSTGKGGSVGHYSQIVWGRTSQLGCGWSVGPTGAKSQKSVLLCQYKTPGNYVNSPVYVVTYPPVVTPTEPTTPTTPTTPTEPTKPTTPTEPTKPTTPTEPTKPTTPTEPTKPTTPDTSSDMPTTTFEGLSASDFKGRANATSPASSYVSWSAPYLYNKRTSGSKIYLTSVNVKCKVDKSDSWLKPEMAGKPLNHETGHYYIGSLMALNFKKQGETTTWAKDTYKEAVRELYNNLLEEYREMERNYDLETENGNNKAMQKIWDADLINEINELKDYWW